MHHPLNKGENASFRPSVFMITVFVSNMDRALSILTATSFYCIHEKLF